MKKTLQTIILTLIFFGCRSTQNNEDKFWSDIKKGNCVVDSLCNDTVYCKNFRLLFRSITKNQYFSLRDTYSKASLYPFDKEFSKDYESKMLTADASIIKLENNEYTLRLDSGYLKFLKEETDNSCDLCEGYKNYLGFEKELNCFLFTDDRFESFDNYKLIKKNNGKSFQLLGYPIISGDSKKIITCGTAPESGGSEGYFCLYKNTTDSIIEQFQYSIEQIIEANIEGEKGDTINIKNNNKIFSKTWYPEKALWANDSTVYFLHSFKDDKDKSCTKKYFFQEIIIKYLK